LRNRSLDVPRHVRIFALGYAITVAVLSAAWLFGLSIVLGSDVASGNGGAIGIALGLALLIVGMLAERRRAMQRYQLVCPAGL
jgi:hypothetical protein